MLTEAVPAPTAPSSAPLSPSLDAQLSPPDSNDPQLSPERVPYEALLGKWHVIASTLPLWRNKRDVTITYSPLAGELATTLDDVVRYNSLSDKPGTKASQVKGVDRLQTDVEGNGARWKWRGRGMLAIATSHWQLLGYSIPSPPSPNESNSPPTPTWAVTYFSSTLFTPAGLDIYARDPSTLTDEHVEGLVKKLEELGGEIEALVKDGGMFRIPVTQ